MTSGNDTKTPISFFKDQVREFVEKRGWTQYHTPKNLVQALNCEAGELSQLLLFKNHTKEDILRDDELLANILDEAADVFIYLISLANSIGFDLTKAFVEKMKRNEEKYSVLEFNNGKYYKK